MPFGVAAGVSFDELFLHPVPAGHGNFHMLFRQIAFAYTACDRVNEHRRSGRLEIILLFAAEIENVPPGTAFRVLNFLDRNREAIEYGDQLTTSRMPLRKMFERIDYPHRVPAHRPSPKMR